jgi:hypothetical protein
VTKKLSGVFVPFFVRRFNYNVIAGLLGSAGGPSVGHKTAGQQRLVGAGILGLLHAFTIPAFLMETACVHGKTVSRPWLKASQGRA